MRKQISPANEFSYTLHAELLQYFNKLDIPGMIHINQTLCCPFLIEQIGQFRICGGNAPGTAAA
jgi:hypothetical protein